MVFRRRRKMFRKKKRTMSRFHKRRIPRNVAKSIYNFKQQVEKTNVSVTAGTPAFFAYSFAMSDVPNLTSLESLYDNFRILAVKLTFYPEFNVSYAAVSSSFTLPEIYTVFDPDSTVAPTTIPELNSYQTLRRNLFTRPHTRYIKPFATYNASAVNGAVGTVVSGLINRKTWFNLQNSGVVYSGIRGAITASSSSQIPAMTIRVSATYYFQCRNVL